jgi:hypothetical protein
MNHNFLGQPSREDLQTLDQLRRQLMPMIGLLDKLHSDMQQKLFRGEVVDWPHIRHTVSVINSYLTSINAYINGSYRHKEEALKDTNGNAILDEEKNPRMLYRDTANEGHADRIGAMHVFPQAPYPMTNERLASMAAVLLDKRLGPPEEKWVEERLRKAAEFAYVPGEWGIEARKVETKEEGADEEDEEDDDGEQGGALEGLPMKRVKGTLNEDQILEMWTVGHKTTFDKGYQRDRGFGEAEEAEDDEEDEDEDEEMEDVKIEGRTPSQGGVASAALDGEEEFEESETPRAQPAAPVVMIQRAPPAVHKPVPGTPVMALGFVHRFMTSGEVQPPPGQR